VRIIITNGAEKLQAAPGRTGDFRRDKMKTIIWVLVKGHFVKSTEINFLRSIGTSPDRLAIRNRSGKKLSGDFSVVHFGGNSVPSPDLAWIWN
jgi:hypothetical protein